MPQDAPQHSDPKGLRDRFAYATLNRVCAKTYAAAPVVCGSSPASCLASYESYGNSLLYFTGVSGLIELSNPSPEIPLVELSKLSPEPN